MQDIALQASADHDLWLSTAEPGYVDDPRSLAAALASYDRGERASSQGLEMSLALLIHPMSQPLPGTEDQDPRFKRLEGWLDQHDSPLYLALAPFNPFRDKADAVGTLLGGSASVIHGLAVRFPATAGITDLTAQTVSTVVLKRMNGKTRWDASRNLRQQVLAAAGDANAEKALGLLAARYRIPNQTVLDDPFSQKVDEFLRSGMADVEELKKLRISGSRTVTLEQTTTRYVRPKASALAKSSGAGGLNALMLWFNLFNLKTAYATVQQDTSPEYIAGFASAILGTAGAVAATLVSARATQKMLMLKLSTTVPGIAFGNGALAIIASNLFTRLVGYPVILIGFTADTLKTIRQNQNGDSEAAIYTFSGGLMVALGSAAILEGALALGGVTLFVAIASTPIAVAIITTGIALLVGGLALHAQASARIHDPIELWAARSIFGNKLNDGEKRQDIRLDFELKLPAYTGINEEANEWFIAYYTPMLLDEEDADSLGVNDLTSRWQDNSSWSPAHWSTIVRNDTSEVSSTVVYRALARLHYRRKHVVRVSK